MISLKPPPSCLYSCPKMMYYYSKQDNKDYMILTPHSENSRKCSKYDFEKDEWIIGFTKYPQGIDPDCHSAAIDEEKDLLYISHGQVTEMFAVLDLNTNKWTIHANDQQSAELYNIDERFVNPISMILPQSQYYLFRKNCAIRYDEGQQKFVNVYGDVSRSGAIYGLLFVKAKNILISIGGSSVWKHDSSDNMQYCEYKECEDDQRDFEWKDFGIKLWRKGAVESCAMIFDTILIAICVEYTEDEVHKVNQMRLLDLDNDKYEWVRTNVSDQDVLDYKSIIVDKYNYVYFGNQYQEQLCKIHASNLLPQQIYAKYKQKYLSLVVAYSRKCIGLNNCVIPQELYQLIVTFYIGIN